MPKDQAKQGDEVTLACGSRSHETQRRRNRAAMRLNNRARTKEVHERPPPSVGRGSRAEPSKEVVFQSPEGEERLQVHCLDSPDRLAKRRKRMEDRTRLLARPARPGELLEQPEVGWAHAGKTTHSLDSERGVWTATKTAEHARTNSRNIKQTSARQWAATRDMGCSRAIRLARFPSHSPETVRVSAAVFLSENLPAPVRCHALVPPLQPARACVYLRPRPTRARSSALGLCLRIPAAFPVLTRHGGGARQFYGQRPVPDRAGLGPHARGRQPLLFPEPRPTILHHISRLRTRGRDVHSRSGGARAHPDADPPRGLDL